MHGWQLSVVGALWNGTVYNSAKPESPMRALSFGPEDQGDIVYLILEDQRRVDLLVVPWMG